MDEMARTDPFTIRLSASLSGAWAKVVSGAMRFRQDAQRTVASYAPTTTNGPLRVKTGGPRTGGDPRTTASLQKLTCFRCGGACCQASSRFSVTEEYEHA